MQAAPHEELIARGRRRVELLDAFHRGLAAELEDDVSLRAGDREGLPHRAASLGDDRARAGSALEDRADGALRVDLIVEDEARPTRGESTRRHPAHDRKARRMFVQMIE